jgi:hypothetical protein
MHKQLTILATVILVILGAPFFTASMLLRGLAYVVVLPSNALARIGNALIAEYERGCRENAVNKDI